MASELPHVKRFRARRPRHTHMRGSRPEYRPRSDNIVSDSMSVAKMYKATLVRLSECDDKMCRLAGWMGRCVSRRAGGWAGGWVGGDALTTKQPPFDTFRLMYVGSTQTKVLTTEAGNASSPAAHTAQEPIQSELDQSETRLGISRSW